MSRLKKTISNKITLWTILGFLFIASLLFVQHNYSFYERPIAKIVEVTTGDATEVTDAHNNKDTLYTQTLRAELKNGKESGQQINLVNEYSSSGAYDHKFTVGHEVFVAIDGIDEKEATLTGIIKDVKRDTQVLFVFWIFVFTLLVIGKKQGFFAIISLALNVILLSYALDIYVKNDTISLLFICGVCVVLFTVTSLLLVNGFNEKTYAAIIATLLGTFLSLLITYVVMWITAENGLRYEEMQYVTRPYRTVFMAGLFIGSLGAVMDVAITMSSSIFELYEKDHDISRKALKTSALDIGKDIMGTMTNILFFAYISGSIPVLILYLKNSTSLPFAFSINLSLEIARALAGGIGIVLAIPIGLYTSLFFVNRKKARL